MNGFVFNNEDLEKSMVVYKITNMDDGKVYIGQTSGKLKTRFRGYPNRVNVYFSRAIKKYGVERFSVSIVKQCKSIKELNEVEENCISSCKSRDEMYGYNLSSGGLNHKMHPLTKKILSEKCSGWHHTKEAKRKIAWHSKGKNNPWYGKKLSEEHKEKLRRAHLGIYPSALTRKRLSRAQKKRKITWGNKISATKTLNIDIGFAVELYKKGYSLVRISNVMGFSVSAIWVRLKKVIRLRKHSYPHQREVINGKMVLLPHRC